VGFTRARSNLVVISKAEEGGTDGTSTMAKIGYATAPGLDGKIDGYVQITHPYPLSDANKAEEADEGKKKKKKKEKEKNVIDPRTYEYGEMCGFQQKEEKVSDNVLLQQPQEVPSPGMVSRPLRMNFKQSNAAEKYLRDTVDEDSPAAKRIAMIEEGNLMHELFSHMGSSRDADKAVRRLVFDGLITDSEAPALKHKVDEALDFVQRQGHDWFSGRWRIYNESNIVWTDAEGNLMQRRPDRIMMDDEEIVVVDFKFGQPHGGYQEQVGEYMNLLRRMGYEQSVKGYLWYVKLNKIEEVKA